MWYVLLTAAAVLLVFIAALRCRRGHKDWDELGRWRYAHRGWHDQPSVPENSMAAFRRAVENGFGAELDVHLMKDGRLAVIHDSSLRRTAGAEAVIEDLTAQELAQYRLEGTEERIPLLEDVLALFAGKAPLVVELKSERGNYNELTAATVALLDKYPVRYCIESFDPRCLIWLRKHRPEIVRGQLSQQFLRHREVVPLRKTTQFILSNLLMNFLTVPDFIAYRFSDRHCLALWLCRRLYGARELSWTIDSKEQLAQSEADGALPIFERFDPRGENV